MLRQRGMSRVCRASQGDNFVVVVVVVVVDDHVDDNGDHAEQVEHEDVQRGLAEGCHCGGVQE